MKQKQSIRKQGERERIDKCCTKQNFFFILIPDSPTIREIQNSIQKRKETKRKREKNDMLKRKRQKKSDGMTMGEKNEEKEGRGICKQ